MRREGGSGKTGVVYVPLKVKREEARGIERLEQDVSCR